MPKISIYNFFKTVTCLCLFIISPASDAENLGPFSIVEPKTVSEFWVNPGFYSYHFKRDVNLNNYNLGLGGEYRYSTTSSVEAGGFHNSNWKMSYYVGWNWQPLELGAVHLGGVVGLINGYPKAFHGGWFPALLPQASIENKNIGLNVIYTPGYQDRLYAALSFQLKVKIY